MPRKNNQGGARPGKNRNQQVKPKSGRRVNYAQNNNTSRRATDAAAFSGAPVASSGDLQQTVSFESRKRGRTLVMKTCAPIAQILRETTSALSVSLLPASGVCQALQLSPTGPSALEASTKVSSGFTSPIWDLIGSAFVRYRVKRLAFTYEPQAAATDGERLVFAFAADPLHPLIWNATPSSTNLLSVADSVAFMPWRAWTMDVSDKLSNELMYTYSDPSMTVAAFTERFSDFGVISVVGATTNAVADLPCGVLYMHTELEFEEFCPISVSRPSLARSLIPKLVKHTARTAAIKDSTRKPEGEQTTRPW